MGKNISGFLFRREKILTPVFQGVKFGKILRLWATNFLQTIEIILKPKYIKICASVFGEIIGHIIFKWYPENFFY